MRTAVRVGREIAVIALSAIARGIERNELAERRTQFNNLIQCVSHGDQLHHQNRDNDSSNDDDN